jgi:SAM-dependent methyltransferase
VSGAEASTRGASDPLSPASAFAAALRGAPCRVGGLGVDGDLQTWRWRSEPDASDEVLLTRCRGTTVDIGCGPGRMTHALLARGIAALGIDVVPEAIHQARERGGVALRRDIFDAIPGEGRWSTALLADGNIGIGGDPVRLLRRVRRLLTHSGRVVVDLSAPGGSVRTHRIFLEIGGARSRDFPWAIVPADQIARLAEAAAFRILEVVDHDGRWFAQLAKAG